MQQKVNTNVMIAVIAVAILIVAFFGYRVYTGPSAVAVKVGKEVRRADPPDRDNEADKKEREEFLRTHPGATVGR